MNFIHVDAHAYQMENSNIRWITYEVCGLVNSGVFQILYMKTTTDRPRAVI